ncbi:MAG: aldo/keto reductase [Actinomycetaceae bacterium]|nr:aldo/keto reductase [Actinomycetaceae bacterium]
MVSGEHMRELSNGLSMPSIGFGTWDLSNENEAKSAVVQAVECGYTLIDGAARYGNEVGVGEGIRSSSLSREELFVTSKVWTNHRDYDSVIEACNKSLKDLKLDYLDLYLIHWPAVSKQYENWKDVNHEVWQALIDLYTQGKVKAIGVSNFNVDHLEALEGSSVMPMVNQIEFHPGFLQEDVRSYCKDHNIVVEGWRPLGLGESLSHEIIWNLAEKYKKNPAQIVLRWCLHKDVVPLPKSRSREHIEQNIDIFDFSLSDDDIALIDTIEGERLGGDPEEAPF